MTDQPLSQTKIVDAPIDNWLDRYCPEILKPYGRLARWDRPIGWWLLLWPCWWSVALSAIAEDAVFPNIFYLALFWLGAVVMRGAGCTYNDIVDRNLDADVARTASRPIPSGEVSVVNAVGFMLLQCLVGFVVLLQFNFFAIVTGLVSLIFVMIYPFMKRFTNWPQLFLGFAFSWGALMGWAAVFGSLSVTPFILYVGAILWTIGYDTIYAHQDREDDALVGLRSTALLFGSRTRIALFLLYAGALICFALAAILVDAGPASFAGLALGSLHMCYQLFRLNIDDPDRCLRLFRSNRDFGAILFAGFVVDAIIAGL